MPTRILTTKLHRPAPPANSLPRPQLSRRLDDGLSRGCKITLISAPAGFGKSSAVSEWIGSQGRPAAWLALDAGDDDPQRFLDTLLAALQGLAGWPAGELAGLLRAGQLPPLEVAGALLVNELGGYPGEFFLVLDDFHMIQDSYILGLFAKLLAYPPPPLHLVLVTREDPPLPLARLRAANLLNEIRAGDLRFHAQEIGCLLNEKMGLGLSAADLRLLEERTEGWPVGLQLAGLSLRERRDPSGFIGALAANQGSILGYLTEEVISRQPAHVQEFLLKTSILDQLNPAVCDAVADRSDSRLLLDQLYRANLFLVPIDRENNWYRFHHLFAGALRSHPAAPCGAGAAALHLRASQWYERNGLADEAIQHALSSSDYARAVDLLEKHAVGMLVQGYSRTVEGWMQAIPPEWRARSPRANLAFAWLHLLRGNFAQVQPYVERLQKVFQPTVQPAAAHLEAEWLALLSLLRAGQANPQESLALGERALEISDPADDPLRSLIYMGFAAAYQALGDYANAVTAFRKIILYGQAGGNFVSELLGLSGLVQMALNHGQLNLALEVSTQGVERVERLGIVSPISAAVYGGIAQVYYQRHRFEEARPYYQRTIHLGNLAGYSDAEIGYHMILSRLRLAEGDLENAGRELDQAVAVMQKAPPAWVREEVIAQQVRLALAQGRLRAAESLLEAEYSPPGSRPPGTAPFHPAWLPGNEKIDYSAGLTANSVLRVLLYRGEVERETDALHQGLELADHLIAAALQGRYLSIALETLQLRGRIQARLGSGEAGLADFARALELAEPEGYIQIFVEEGRPTAQALAQLSQAGRVLPVRAGYAAQILAAFAEAGQPGGGTGPPLSGSTRGQEWGASPEALTSRELEVLRLIAEGLKYEDIAGRLYISLNTVRSYIKAIYAKLNVDNRTRAVAQARQRGWI
jgi:LuxR family maltose regulon positive regulatory protein